MNRLPSLALAVKRRGFTLIEILVVVMIIAVLAVLLASAIPRTLAETRSSKCAANLRQIGVAARLWSSDNDGRIVPVFYPGDKSDPLSTNLWPSLLAPYMDVQLPLKSVSAYPMFICPEAPKTFGYGYNYFHLSYIQTSTGRYQWATYAEVPNPSQTLMVVDELVPSDGSAIWRPYVRPPSYSSQNPTVAFRHPGSNANVLWLDGHVSKEKKDGPLMANDDLWDKE